MKFLKVPTMQLEPRNESMSKGSLISTAANRSLKSALWVLPVLIVTHLDVNPAHALPFKENCASMQQYWNATSSQNQQVSDFENSQLRDGYLGMWIVCGGGYITIRSSKGTEICKADIRYYIQSTERRKAGEMVYVPYSCYLR